MAQTHTNLGHALLTLAQTGRKDLEDPEVHYRAALRYDGRFVHAYTGLAEVLEAKGKKEENHAWALAVARARSETEAEAERRRLVATNAF